MTLTIYFLLLTTKNITHWHQKIISAEFTLPKTIRIRDFIQNIIRFTVIMEVLGTLFLFIGFYQKGITGWKGLWFAFFHSVSSFCTAGFSLFDNSLVNFKDHVLINFTISTLAIAGSLGFIVITDLWYRITKKSNKLCFTTKIILYGFLLLLCLGTLLIYATENSRSASGIDVLASFFQAMTTMTTVGMNTIDISVLSLPIILLTIFLMFIRASPSGTAGGLKITTFTAMLAILKSRLLGRRKITFLKNKIPFKRLYVATSTFVLYTSLIFIGTFVLAFTESFEYKEILFEVASALGTVGLSLGVTSSLSFAGKISIILLMFVGRVGVLTFGFALLHNINKRNKKTKYREERDDLAV